MNKHKVVIVKELTDEDINDILDSALHGCRYWVGDIKIKLFNKAAPPPAYLSQALTQGHSLKIHDSEEDKWHTLTLNKFIKGLSLSYGFNYEDYDKEEAEQVLQRALFKEAIYG